MALTEDRVVDMSWAASTAKHEQLGFIFVEGQTVMKQMQEGMGVVFQNARVKFAHPRNFTYTLMNDFNAKIDGMNTRVSQALAETQALGQCSAALLADLNSFPERLQKAMGNVKTSSEAKMVSIRDNLPIWFDGLVNKVGEAIRTGVGMGSDLARFGQSPSRAERSVPKAAGIDKKEVAVWKLLDQISEAVFRHWFDAVDLQLEAEHHSPFLEIQLDKIRRQEVEIDGEFS